MNAEINDASLTYEKSRRVGKVASLRCVVMVDAVREISLEGRVGRLSGEKSSGSRSIDFPLKRTDLPHDPARLSAHATASPIPRLIKCDRPIRFTGDIYISIRSIGIRVFKRPFDLTSLLRLRPHERCFLFFIVSNSIRVITRWQTITLSRRTYAKT